VKDLRACVLAALPLWLAPSYAMAQSALPPGFVYLRDVDPTIVQDIRYAGANNFVGRPLGGYGAAECVLRRDVALALKQVQADLAPTGRGLKVYDCYRPAQAVRTMVQWARDGVPAGASQRFFPRLPKTALFAAGYLASVSRHSASQVSLPHALRPRWRSATCWHCRRPGNLPCGWSRPSAAVRGACSLPQ